MLSCAKFRLWIATENTFPDITEELTKAADLLKEAGTEMNNPMPVAKAMLTLVHHN